MIPGDVNKEEISEDPQSQILERHDPNNTISGHDGSLKREKSRAIPGDGVEGESSENPHTQKLNSKNQRSDRDNLPHLVGDDGSTATQQSLASRPSSGHEAFNYAGVSLLFGLVAAKYQAKSEDPFEANPAASWSCVAAIIAHSQMPLILKNFQRLPTRFLLFLNRAASVSGVVSFLSLISLLLPQLPGQILLYASWALFVGVSGWPTLQSTYNWLLTKIRTLTINVISFAKNLSPGLDVNSQQQSLPK